ncbi:MAG: type II secretion system protein GspG [Hyalangium sp.]|uniref:type II secretion system protein GspG n=1 Tax=Hyalangium sp. TaxID=2028555 RepID=UPI00389A5D7B
MSDTKKARRPSPARLLLGIAMGVCLAVALAVVQFSRKPGASWARIHADVAMIDAALQKYKADHGAYPEENDTLEVLVPKYLPSLPMDPWGRPYIYENNGKKPLVITLGSDGERGGDGDEQDHHQLDGHVR